jgi:hypothetical protein
LVKVKHTIRVIPSYCLPSREHRRPPTLTHALPDPYGVYHVVDLATRQPVCRWHAPAWQGIGWEPNPCPVDAALPGDPVPVLNVPRESRCPDGMSWPTYVEPSTTWPLPPPTDTHPTPWLAWWLLYDSQSGKCGACGIMPPHSFDYDERGVVRGLLCGTCAYNVSLDETDCHHRPRCYKKYRANPPAKNLNWTFTTS